MCVHMSWIIGLSAYLSSIPIISSFELKLTEDLSLSAKGRDIERYLAFPGITSGEETDSS